MTLARFIRLTLALPLVFALGSAFAAAKGADAASVEAVAPWVRWLPAGLPAAGYVTLVNHAAADAFLVGVSSPDYGEVMLHESYTAKDGSAGMRMVGRLRLPAGGSVTLAPGGYHLMLLDARHHIAPGDKVTIELAFDDGRKFPVQFLVKPANTQP